MGTRSYLVCATPRTGSTLLCNLLTSTEVAGRPESYFREPDRSMWTSRFGLPTDVESVDARTFAGAARRAGSTPNGVFAARIMWGTIQSVVDGLHPGPRTETDLHVLSSIFGPLVLVHLRRADIVGQAVSWARAEQTGYWQHGDQATADPQIDLDLIDDFVRTVDDHNTAWQSWFTAQGARPYVVTYEGLVAQPLDTVRGILDVIGVEPGADWEPAPPDRKQADETNAAWVRRYRDWRGASGYS